MNFISSLKNEVNNLKSNFEEFDTYFTLTINSKKIIFKKDNSCKFPIKPNDWLKSNHKNNKLHEPGMVATLLLLSKLTKKVIFYDIGSCFGYFSNIVKKNFSESRCINVEPNPEFCKCIQNISEFDSGFEVRNCLIAKYSSLYHFFIEGFVFTQMSKYEYLFLSLLERVKNFIKLI